VLLDPLLVYGLAVGVVGLFKPRLRKEFNKHEIYHIDAHSLLRYERSPLI